jgi:hypothetical protein
MIVNSAGVAMLSVSEHNVRTRQGPCNA